MPITTPRAEPEVVLNNILAEVRAARALLDQRDAATRSRIAGLESTVNSLMRQLGV